MGKKSIVDVDVENKVTPPLVRAVVDSPFQNIPRKSRAVEESPFQNLPRTPMLFEAYRSTSSEKTDESMIRTMSVTVCPFDGIKKQSPRQESRKLTIWEKGALFGKFILFDLGRGRIKVGPGDLIRQYIDSKLISLESMYCLVPPLYYVVLCSHDIL